MYLYEMIIGPIKHILEIFYVLFVEFTDNAGFAVIGLSIVVTLCCLPLYAIAEHWQEIERKTQEKLAPGLDRIKKAFTGDERYMMTAAFYRENHYSPIMALRSSLGLLIQIPFFVAAYTFLSSLKDLYGTSFYFITDLGSPDAIFHIGSFPINILPIAMTIINCIAGAIYTRGFAIKDKVQVYGMALVFLVILYNSPSGLVLYWTMNNVFSLVKNIFYKLKHPFTVLYCCAVLIALIGCSNAIFFMQGYEPELRAMLILFCVLLISSPLIIRIVKLFYTRFVLTLSLSPAAYTLLFFGSALILALVSGFIVPSMLIESETTEFSYVDNYTSPFIFLLIAFCKTSGLFILWSGCFYALFSNAAKRMLTILFLFLASYALCNSFIFSGNYGSMDQLLEFMENQDFTGSHMTTVVNLFCAAAILTVLLLLLKYRHSVLLPYTAIIIISLLSIGIKNSVVIQRQFSQTKSPQQQALNSPIEPIFHLSKTEKNVLVFMQDRALLPLVEDIFTEAPGLVKQWDGFVFYKNAISLGQLTMLGVPGIYGGYDYTPYEINRRTDKTLQQKHNEALLSLPIVFHEAGYAPTVSDMPYENYLQQPTEQMYRNYPYINAVHTVGSYTDYWYTHHPDVQKVTYTSLCINHNLCMFGIFKMVPPVLRRLIYHNVWWNTIDPSVGRISRFMDNYTVIDLLPELVDTTAATGTYTAIDNEATHEPIYLQAPDYLPVTTVTDYGDTKWADYEQYHVQACVFRAYGRFFDYLRKEGVYDNTRIIIVSDHGAGFSSQILPPPSEDIPFQKERIISCLLYKDFNAHTEGDSLQIDMTFMTNADTGALATKDIIPDAKNPFTGLPFAVPDKSKYIKFALPLPESTRNRANTQFKIASDEWYTVKDSIFIQENWSRYIKE